MLYIHLTHGRQTFKIVLKNKLHQLRDAFFITCSCDVITQNPSTCNLSCDAYSSSYFLRKLSVNRYCMDNILCFSDHISFETSLVSNLRPYAPTWRQGTGDRWQYIICPKRAIAWKANMPLVLRMFTCYTMYTINVNVQLSFTFNVTFFYLQNLQNVLYISFLCI